MTKSFIITIDTEGDNLWKWRAGETKITTENVKFLPRFQALCDEFGFKPVWLTNYEMVTDPDYVAFSKKAMREGRCEIGMHLHAVNNPPIYELPVAYPSNFPYLVEYPNDVVEEKILTLKKLLEDTFEENIVSHRAGRWAMNDFYSHCLKMAQIKIDCSVTPGISWYDTAGITANSHGSDYSKSPLRPFFIDEEKQLLEVPVSIRQIHYATKPALRPISVLRYLKHRVVGYKAWMRPNGKNLKELLTLAEQLKNDNSDYVMLMLHSSEMMPGGSPTFKTAEEIEHLYNDLKTLFSYISTFCEGHTLKEYTIKKEKCRDNIPFKQLF